MYTILDKQITRAGDPVGKPWPTVNAAIAAAEELAKKDPKGAVAVQQHFAEIAIDWSGAETVTLSVDAGAKRVALVSVAASEPAVDGGIEAAMNRSDESLHEEFDTQIQAVEISAPMRHGGVDYKAGDYATLAGSTVKFLTSAEAAQSFAKPKRSKKGGG